MTWKFLIAWFMENANKQQKIFLSACKLECGPQEINSREICLHYFDIFREFEQTWLGVKKHKFILKVKVLLPSPIVNAKAP